MFYVFLFLSASDSCPLQIDLTTDASHVFIDCELKMKKTLVINSSIPKMGVIFNFHKSTLIDFYHYNPDLHEEELVSTPPDINTLSAVDYGDYVGRVKIYAKKTINVRVAAVLFDNDCKVRILSNENPSTTKSNGKIEFSQEKTTCYFNGVSTTKYTVNSISPDSKIYGCKSRSKCVELSKGDVYPDGNSASYLKYIPISGSPKAEISFSNEIDAMRTSFTGKTEDTIITTFRGIWLYPKNISIEKLYTIIILCSFVGVTLIGVLISFACFKARKNREPAQILLEEEPVIQGEARPLPAAPDMEQTYSSD